MASWLKVRRCTPPVTWHAWNPYSEGTDRAQGCRLPSWWHAPFAAAPLDGTDTAWLDLCAGPGGGAALLGALGIQRGASWSPTRRCTAPAQLVESSMRPCPRTATVLTGDGRQIPRDPAQERLQPAGSIRPGQLFDRVMVDVPCSVWVPCAAARGALAQVPARYCRAAALQRQLLDAAIEATRPGGVIAYVTCSRTRQKPEHVAEVLESGAVSLVTPPPHCARSRLHTDGANGEPVSVLAGEGPRSHPEIKVKRGCAGRRLRRTRPPRSCGRTYTEPTPCSSPCCVELAASPPSITRHTART